MTKKQKKHPASLELWKKHGQIPSDWLVRALYTPSTYSQYATPADLCADSDISITAEEIKQIRICLEKDIQHQIFVLGVLMYRYFQVSGKWPLDNENNVRMAYCRHLLAIPAEEDIPHASFGLFEQKLNDAYHDHQLNALSEKALHTRLENFRFSIFGKQLIPERYPVLNQALLFFGSKHQIYFDSYGISPAALFGHTLLKKIHPYTIFIIKSETARTPNYVMSNPALHRSHMIALRDESLKAIFHMKWAPAWDMQQQYFFRSTIETDIFWNLSLGIKEKVLHLYEADKKTAVLEKESDIVKDMRETILYHEIGHGLTTEHLLPIENVSVGSAPEIYNIWFYDGLLEFLADFAPKRQDLHGAMYNIARVAEKNPLRATRMFYIYLSDIWFYDTDDSFMLPYADFMALVLSRYIRPDQSVDFARMSADLVYQDNRTEKKQLSLYERVYELFLWDTDEMKQIVKQAKFQLTNLESFSYIKQLRIQNARKNYPNIDPESDAFLTPFWQNMFNYLRVFSDPKPLETYLETQIQKNMKKMFILAAGRSVAEAYQYDHRRYIQDTYQKLGFLSKSIPWKSTL